MVHNILCELKSDVFELDILGKLVYLDLLSPWRDFIFFFAEHNHPQAEIGKVENDYRRHDYS